MKKLKMKYRAVDGSRLSQKDAALVGHELSKLEDLTAESVVAYARSRASPLHRFFEWDDTKAAAAYRLDQARYLIRSVDVVTVGDPNPKQVRAFVHIDGASAYLPMAKAMTNASLRSQVIAQARKELEWWKKRHSHLIEFAEVFAAIERLRA